MITPLHLRILLHAYTTPDAISTEYSGSVAVEYTQELIDAGLIMNNCATAKGKCYIEHILNTPFPVTTYIVPRHDSDVN